jgi:sugar lactone lactonase YvrE
MASYAICVFLSLLGAAESTITTAGGTGKAGFSGDGGPAASAQLNMPFDLAFDGHGNLFFSDTFNHRIRRIDHASGTISTVAGTGRAGYSGDGGLAVQAQLNEPYGIAVDHRGNLFVADRLNRRVRRIDVGTKVITTVAGDGTTAHSGDGGPGPKAGIIEPNGVALRRGGQVLLIADVAGNRIRSLDLASGVITTSKELAVDAAGNIWIVDTENHAIRFIDAATQQIRTAAGTGSAGGDGDGGPATIARLDRPHGVAIGPDGSCWIADTNNHRLRRVTPGH